MQADLRCKSDIDKIFEETKCVFIAGTLLLSDRYCSKPPYYFCMTVPIMLDFASAHCTATRQ